MIAKNTSIITENVKIEGKLSFPVSVKVDGEVTGDIKSKGTLIIDRELKVEANAETKDAIVSGNFKGKMYVLGQIEIKSTGKFIGDLIQDKPLLVIEKAGIHTEMN